MTNQEKIKELEASGDLDPNCKMCVKIFYPYYQLTWHPVKYNSPPFAPGHKASVRCESGKNSHCTCDTCF